MSPGIEETALISGCRIFLGMLDGPVVLLIKTFYHLDYFVRMNWSEIESVWI